MTVVDNGTVFTRMSDQLGTRDSRKIGNNTYLERLSNGDIGVRLHQTHVVVAHTDGTVTLNSGGWNTVTTRDRINKHAGVTRVSQSGGITYLANGMRFFDGVRLDSGGLVLNPREPSVEAARDAEVEKLRLDIKKYAAMCASDPVAPATTDCTACGVLHGADTGNEHLLLHMEDGYVVGSLIVNALRERGWDDMQISLAISSDGRGFWANQIRASIRRYMSRRLMPDRAPMQ